MQDRNIFEYFATYNKNAKRAGIDKKEIEAVFEIAKGMKTYEECRDYLLGQIAII